MWSFIAGPPHKKIRKWYFTHIRSPNTTLYSTHLSISQLIMFHKVQIPLDEPDQTLSKTRVCDKVGRLWSGLVRSGPCSGIWHELSTRRAL